MNKEKVDELIHNNSFKIKPIYIEVKKYSYYHAAIDDKNSDCNERFVGRNRLIKKIRSFIFESTSNTGTYLITGFRGMGKTSLVNKALSILNPNHGIKPFFTVWVLLLVTVFINKQQPIINLVRWVWLVICIVYLIFQFKNSERRKVKGKSWIKNLFYLPNHQREKYGLIRILYSILIFLTSLLILLCLQKDINLNPHDSNSRFYNFRVLTAFIFISYLLFNLFVQFELFKKDVKVSNTYLLVIIKIIIFLIILIVDIGITFFLVRETLITFFLLIIAILITQLIYDRTVTSIQNEKYSKFKKIRYYFDFKQFLIIKINLGKDNLSEKDVLKYITNEIYNEYKKWYYKIFNLKRGANVLLLSLLLLVFLNGIYHLIDKKYSYQEINYKYNISKYFPSQAFLKYNKDKDSILKVNEDGIILISKQKHFLKCKKDSIIKINEDNIKEIYIDNPYDILIKYNASAKLSSKQKYFLKHQIGYKNIVNIKKDTTKIITEAGNVKVIVTDEQSLLNKASVAVGMVTNTFDYLFLNAYIGLRNILFGPYKNNKYAMFFYPKFPSLLVYLTFFLILFTFRFLPTKLIPFKSHLSALRELRVLQNEIEASITKEQNRDSSIGSTTLFSFRKSAQYKPLEAKDISQRLIHVLDKIDAIKPLFTKVKFILVFDELDKISSKHNQSISNKEDEYNIKDEIRYQARRKERIYSILSGMKHFLNTAKIKSIFIAGREMYDAALAGISDRESSLDSIFSDNKIYVNSFYTEGEDNNLTDITSMTEYYVCKFIIPTYYIHENMPKNIPSLKLYNQYIKEVLHKGNESSISKKERIKVINTLKNFIKYVTYRSNGAPRKISAIFEQYLEAYTQKDLDSKDKIVFADNDQSLCLKFSYYDQYKFSFVSYLITPIFLSIGNYMTEYSDKLLVSISYMLDHLFKHHKFGLSYRTLALTPEIIDVNKEPEFRIFLDKLIGFLSKNHLRKIVSGIYDYKFQSKTATELRFLSKINELEAAAFNFTLDESIELKRYFRRKLKFLEEKYAKDGTNININTSQQQEYKNAVSLIYMYLGDLHFNDEEFGDAIEHYLEAIQIIRQKNIHEMYLYDFVIFVRNKLKLGLAFEKNKNFDSAQMTYAELTDVILMKRNIPIRKIGLCRFYLKKNQIDDFIRGHQNEIFQNLKFYNPSISNDFNGIKTEMKELFNNQNELIIIGRPKPEIMENIKTEEDWKKIRPYTDMETFYDIKDEYLSKNHTIININFKPLKWSYKNTTFENLRILYQPIIAKLHLIEKSSPNKLKDIDIVRAVEEFQFFKRPINTTQKRVVVAEFYNKLGDLLYFKNGTINKCLKEFLLLDTSRYKLISSPIDATIIYTKSLAVLLLPIFSKKCDEEEGTVNSVAKKSPASANENTEIKKISIIEYYTKINSNTYQEFFKNVVLTIDNIDTKLRELHSDDSYQKKYSNDYLSSIANGIIDLAGALLSFTDDAILFNKKNEYVRIVNLELCIKLFYHANLIFKRIGEHRLAKSQLLKILHILYEKKNDTQIELSTILKLKIDDKDVKVDGIVESCIKYIYRTYNQSTRPEIKKVRGIFNLQDDNYATIYKNTTITAEINEVVHLYWLLYFKYAKNNNNQNIFGEELNIEKAIEYSYKNTNPFSNINNKYNRILELSLRLKVNKYLFENTSLFNTIKGIKTDYFSDDDINSFLIIDSIGACNEIIKSHNLFDVNYVTTTNLVMAKAHGTMGFWCEKMKNPPYKSNIEEKESNIKERKSNIEEKVKSILNTKNLMYLSHYYHYDLAQQYNYKVKEFHHRGNALQEFLLNASYLDDFFNDNLIHFSISIERNTLNNNEVDNNIEKLKEKSDGSKVDKYKNYYL